MVHGGFWALLLRVANKSLSLTRTIVLARLLAPEDFGQFAVAMLSISLLDRFSRTGFEDALIQKDEDIEPYLNTAWSVSALRGILIFSVLFLGAPIIAKFFDSTQSAMVIKILALNSLLTGFRSIGIVYFQKEMAFNKLFFYEIFATVIELLVAVTLAFILRSVWAMVFANLSANFVRLVISHAIYPSRPKLALDKQKFHELFRFGKWVMGSSILIFLNIQGDDIFVGKLLGVTQLGLYQMAFLISNLPATEISYIVSLVALPAFSKIQNDPPKLRTAYLNLLQLTTFVAIPIAVLIYTLSPPFINLFLGVKWIPLIPALKVLVFFGAIRTIMATTVPFFHAVGKPAIITKAALIQLIITVLAIYPLTVKYQIIGTSLAILIAGFAILVYLLHQISIIAAITKAALLRLFVIPLSSMSAVWIFITIFFHPIETTFVNLLVIAAVVIALYSVFSYFTDRWGHYHLRANFDKLFRPIG